ncbi:MAG: TonB-dependent receptor [Saprospiraceae bacterium]|nr:TonB-dependent receptor [Saprospiraceae bacterium]
MRFLLSFLLIWQTHLNAQSGLIKGQVTDALTNDPVEFANVLIAGTSKGEITDAEGRFELEVEPGFYSVEVSFLGYKTEKRSEIEVTSSRPVTLDFQLEPASADLQEVVVKAESFRRPPESPLSLRNIGITEIKRNPGGNRDISLVIRSFPGVTSTASFRNDLIIRGGAPNENRFYLDGMEVPTINHFATQGASGGPASILNVDFIKEVDFYSGAFPANRSNSLSSVFNFRQKDGRDDRPGMTATVGATDVGVTFEGPIGEKTTFLASARRSYLQFLFEVLELPFLPTYNDFNLKVKTKFDQKNELTILGIGAIDDFRLNLEANETEAQRFILNNLPDNEQWNYATGLVYKRYGENGFTTFVLSRNTTNYDAEKYLGNDSSTESNLLLRYNSREIENHLRVERTIRTDDWKWLYGARYDYVRYTNSTFNKIFTRIGPEDIEYSSSLDFHKYGAFGQVSRSFYSDKLDLSFGLSIGGNSYSDDMINPMDQFSPRLSMSYNVWDDLRINFNTGIYYQLPPYTSLGYRENGELVNRNSDISPIRSDHFVAGFSFLTEFDAKISVEGYYKRYNNYPFLLRDSIALANLGGDFGVIGNEPVKSMSKGRTYGLEIFYQQRLYKGYYGLAAYTLGWSEFTNGEERYVPSSWDARNIVNLTLGKRFKNNWEVGVKWRYQDGLPNTPFDPNSNLVQNWQRNNGPIPDYSQLNTLRQEPSSEVDIRIDKRWFFENWSLDVYLDIRNVFGNAVASRNLYLDVELDEDGLPVGDPEIINPNAPIEQQRYKTKLITDDEGTPLPTIGIVVKI